MLKMFKSPGAGRATLMEAIKQLSYLVATALFIFSLHWMNDPKTARRGVFAGAGGMLLAVSGHVVFQRHLASLVDHRGDCRGLRRRLSAVASAADRRAAANRAVARLRRIGGGTGRHGRVLHVASASRPAMHAHRSRHGGRSAARLSHLHRQLDGHRQVARGVVDSAAAGHLSEPKPQQHRPVAVGGVVGHCSWCCIRTALSAAWRFI